MCVVLALRSCYSYPEDQFYFSSVSFLVGLFGVAGGGRTRISLRLFPVFFTDGDPCLYAGYLCDYVAATRKAGRRNRGTRRQSALPLPHLSLHVSFALYSSTFGVCSIECAVDAMRTLTVRL